MAFGQNEVKIIVSADTGSAERNVGGISGKLKGMLKPAAIGAATAIAGLGVAGIKMGLDFEKGMAEVFTLLPKLSEEGFQSLKSDVLDLSKEMGIATDDVVPALYAAISAGVKPAEALEFIETNARLAIGGVTDLATAVDLTTTVMNAWNLESQELGRVQDVLFAGVQAGKTTIDELGASMFQVAPIAAAVGVGVAEVTAAMATLTAQGVPTAQASTQLKAAFAELAKEGTKADKMFRDVTGQAFPAFIEGGGDVSSALKEMEEFAADNNLSILDMFGSIEAGQGILGLTGENAESFNENLLKMENSSGLVKGAFDKMNGTFDRQFQILKTQLGNILLEIGEVILPLLIGVLEDLNPWLQEKIPQAIAFMKETWEELQPKIEEFMVTMREDVLPVLQDIVAFVQYHWPFIQSVIVPILEAILERIEFTFRTIGNIITFWSAVMEGDWGAAWDAIKSQFEDTINFITNTLRAAFDLINALTSGKLGDMINTVTGKLGDLFNVFAFIWESIKNVTAGFFSDLVSMGSDLGTDLANAITAAFKAAWNAVAGAINTAIPNDITIGGGSFLGVPIPSIGIDFEDNPLPLFTVHRGGIVPGRPGQEVLAVLEGGEQVIPRSARLSDADGLVINQNITVNVEERSPAALAHAVEMAGLELGESLALEGI